MLDKLIVWIKVWIIARMGKRDGRFGISQVEDRAVSLIGARPVFDPGKNSHDRRIQDDLDPKPVKAQGAAMHRAEDAVARIGRPTLRTLGVCGVCLLEVLGCNLLMRELGYGNPERFGFALLLTLFLIAVTHWICDQWSNKNYWFAIVTSVALLVVASAVALLRIQDREAVAGSSQLLNISLGVVTLAFTLGAGFMAAYLIRLRRPAVEPWRRLCKERRRFRSALRRLWWAKAYAEGVSRKQSRWDAVEASVGHPAG
jgi:hypothetical protein